jgi:hypothetical protein
MALKLCGGHGVKFRLSQVKRRLTVFAELLEGKVNDGLAEADIMAQHILDSDRGWWIVSSVNRPYLNAGCPKNRFVGLFAGDEFDRTNSDRCGNVQGIHRPQTGAGHLLVSCFDQAR